MKNKILIIVLLSWYLGVSQEFNAVVVVNSDKIQNTNRRIYKTLENSISEFINQTKWTDKKYKTHERINCAFTIIINEQDQNSFKANLQVQAMRPVYGASYETPILNINDQNFNFSYTEFQPLIFNENTFENNITATIAFYVYTILGIDADTFALNGGAKYFKKAENIVRLSQQRGGGAWQNKVGEQNRYTLIDGLNSSKMNLLHTVYYNYHRKGLDIFSLDENKAKKQIAKEIISLKSMHNKTITNYLLRVFVDTKANEMVSIFSGGKSCGREREIKNTLNTISATQSNKWRKI